jgi:hypothetical protein
MKPTKTVRTNQLQIERLGLILHLPSAIVELVRKDIDVNEHDKSSNLIVKQIKGKLQTFYCRSAFHSHSRN